MLRSDLKELFSEDARAQAISDNTYTLAGLLTAAAPIGPVAEWQPPRLDGQKFVVQPHCHQHAVMGFGADVSLLEKLGATITELSGCCGLAGNFGMEKGHSEVSVTVAENALLPALRAAGPDTTLLADGFSCRTQASQLGGVDGIHLAELLASNLARPQ